MATKQHTQVAIVPTPGIGHLIPLIELAKRLVVHHNFLVTVLIPTDGSPVKPQKAILEALPKSISSIFLPPVSLDDLPEDILAETRIALTLTRSLPALREYFKVLAESTQLVASVVDLFGTEVFDVAKEFGVSSYILFPSTAMVLSLIFSIRTQFSEDDVASSDSLVCWVAGDDVGM
jgi:hydroquinone glucosyltransferase